MTKNFRLLIYPHKKSVHVKCRIIRFWAGLTDSTSDKMSCKVYSLLYDLYSNLKISSKWLDCIKSILVDSGFDCVWYSQSFYDKELFCRNIIQSLKDVFILSWKDSLEQSSKCILYRNIKLNFRCESYIIQLPDTYIYALIKFRCSNHKLRIELW